MDAATGLLPYGVVVDLLSTLREGHEPAATEALVELSDWLSGHRRDPLGPLARADSAALAQVGDAVAALDQVLAARMDRVPVHCSAETAWAPGRFVSPARDYRPAGRHWKPRDALWTSPAVNATQSDWSMWAAYTSDTPPPRLRVVFDRPPATNVALVSSLAEADRLVAECGTVAGAVHALHASGISVIDFSWRCVLEGEISAFRGQRSAVSFPCGLGTACSLWLEVQAATIRPDTRPQAIADAPPADWFTYGGR